jgi:ABC-type lipoprotein export system ATPase subunit
VFIDGKNAKGFSLRTWSELRKNSIAVVFQDLRLFPELTALENILIKAKLAGSVSKEEILSNAEKLGITERMNVRCRFLSLGQQQRVAILRGLAQPFRFLLLDEPFSHLDEKNIALATSIITQACRKNNAGLLLTSLGGNHLFDYHQSLTI